LVNKEATCDRQPLARDYRVNCERRLAEADTLDTFGHGREQSLLNELRPNVMGVIEKGKTANVLRREHASGFAEQCRAAHGHQLLLEKKIDNESRAEGRAAISHRQVDAICLEVREPFSRQYAELDIGCASLKAGNRGMSHFAAKLGATLMVSALGSGRSAEVALATIAKARCRCVA
jgi:hypothetical protein